MTQPIDQDATTTELDLIAVQPEPPSATPSTPAPTPPGATPTAPGTPTPPPKSGLRSTEFWLSVIATVLGLVLASGLIKDGGTAAQIIGGVLSVLSSLGYTAARTKLKGGSA